MVVRFLASEEEKPAVVGESLNLAKQAVTLDLSDGYSWYVLGNAHLTNFFTNAKSIDELEMALKAYNQSETHYRYSNPDLHYNRATVFKFMERYSEAANEFKRASEIDPALNGVRDAEEIVRFLYALTTQINTK
jgi:tetratricopeptide (TPR) repeat protein